MTDDATDHARAQLEAGLAAGKTPIEVVTEAIRTTHNAQRRDAIIRKLAAEAAARGEWDDQGPLPADLAARFEADADWQLKTEQAPKLMDDPLSPSMEKPSSW